jgi:hypothetical protein
MDSDINGRKVESAVSDDRDWHRLFPARLGEMSSVHFPHRAHAYEPDGWLIVFSSVWSDVRPEHFLVVVKVCRQVTGSHGRFHHYHTDVAYGIRDDHG